MKKRTILSTILATVFCAATLPLEAQDFASVSTSANADLKAALAELSKAQQRIAEEKIPLASRLAEVEDQVIAKRKEVDAAARSRDNTQVDLNTMRSEVKAQTTEVKFIGGVLGEYVNAFDARLHDIERTVYSDRLKTARNVAGNVDMTELEKLNAQLGVVGESLDRIDKLLGGESFDGRALTDSGKLESGKFVLIGPLAAFASTESEALGLARTELNETEARVAATAEPFRAGLVALINSGEGELPVDATMGNADKIAETKETFVEHISKGGPVVAPILLLGILAVLIGLIKWVQIAGIRLAKPRDMQIVLDRLKDGNEEGAMEHARSIKGPVGELLQIAVAHADEKKEYIEEALYEKMLNTKPGLERWMPFVALSAATAPLLGLLGTVTGMINTFRLISVFGTGDPKMLSSGISEALVTTEFGLIVAIPSLLIHAFISRKAKSVLGSMEQTSVAFINGVPGDGDADDSDSNAAGSNPTANDRDADEPLGADPVPA